MCVERGGGGERIEGTVNILIHRLITKPSLRDHS